MDAAETQTETLTFSSEDPGRSLALFHGQLVLTMAIFFLGSALVNHLCHDSFLNILAVGPLFVDPGMLVFFILSERGKWTLTPTGIGYDQLKGFRGRHFEMRWDAVEKVSWHGAAIRLQSGDEILTVNLALLDEPQRTAARAAIARQLAPFFALPSAAQSPKPPFSMLRHWLIFAVSMALYESGIFLLTHYRQHLGAVSAAWLTRVGLQPWHLPLLVWLVVYVRLHSRYLQPDELAIIGGAWTSRRPAARP